MNGLPPQNNPVSIARESMTMGKESGDRTFKLLALVMMASAGVATLLNAAHIIWRDTFGSRRCREQGRRDAWPPPDSPEHESPAREETRSRPEEPYPERRWSGKAGLARRAPEAGQQWADYSGQQEHNRQR